MHTQQKKIIAGLLTAAMLVPVTVSFAEPLCASAYELLGETTFEHKMIPWTPVEIIPAKQDFQISDGAAHLTVLVPTGEDKSQWDLEFRHRNLSFKKGHEYKVSFQAKAKRAGMELCSFIGSMDGSKQFFVLNGKNDTMQIGPDMGGQWCVPVKLKNEYKEYTGIFKPTEDIEDMAWVFRYAADSSGYGGDAVVGDELWFDNMSIEDITDTEYEPPVKKYGYTGRNFSGLENNYISVNQLGYYPKLAKIAVLGDDQGNMIDGAKPITLTGSYDYEIVNVNDDTVVFTGKTSLPVKDADSGDTVCKIDFTAFDESGKYYIRIKSEKWRSCLFKIGTDIYSLPEHNLLQDALNYFYQNRAGADIEEKYITSGEKKLLAHRKDYDESVGFVQTAWNNTTMTKPQDAEKNSSSRINTSGGWFTGSDYHKDMTEGGTALWALQNLFERANQTEKGKVKFADGAGSVIVPETDNAYPDILDECRYELDYMAKMKVQPDEKTWGKYNGLYYHSIQGIGFRPNMPAYEHEYHAAYAVQPPTFAATLNYAACAAQGARIWAEYDKEYATALLTSAKEAYAAYKEYFYEAATDEENNAQSLYAPQQSNYSDAAYQVQNNAYQAACELYISAAEMNDPDASAYLKELSDSQNAFCFSDDRSVTSGSMSLMLHQNLLNSAQKQMLAQSLITNADTILEVQQKQGYGIPYQSKGGFAYGSNECAVNHMIALAYAYDLTGELKYLNGVTQGMDYLLGSNPMAFSFITGYGSYSAEKPAHRYWNHELDSTLPSAPDGVLASGANAVMLDKYLRGLGFTVDEQNTPSQRFYADSAESWATNSASVISNASLAWIVSFLQDEAPTVSEGSIIAGDANGSGKTDIADAVILNRYLLGNGFIKIPAAADLNKDGKLNAADLTLLKRLLIK